MFKKSNSTGPSSGKGRKWQRKTIGNMLLFITVLIINNSSYAKLFILLVLLSNLQRNASYSKKFGYPTKLSSLPRN
jgi:hypothetical protein